MFGGLPPELAEMLKEKEQNLPKKPIKKRVEVMFFSLSAYEKRVNWYGRYNPNRHLKYSTWLKRQCLPSKPKTVFLEA